MLLSLDTYKKPDGTIWLFFATHYFSENVGTWAGLGKIWGMEEVETGQEGPI